MAFIVCDSIFFGGSTAVMFRNSHTKDLSRNGKKKTRKLQPRDHGVRSGQRFASISSAKTAATQRELKDFSVRNSDGEV